MSAATPSRVAVTEREMELVCQREDLRQALADALAWIESLRTLIGQAAAEVIHGELTDGTLASMVEVTESDLGMIHASETPESYNDKHERWAKTLREEGH